MDYRSFQRGMPLHFSQIKAMAIKKFLYSIRNYILLIIQFVIPAFFIVMTMLSDQLFTGNKDLPELEISFDSYLTTVTTLERSALPPGSVAEAISTNYENMIKALPADHTLMLANKNFEDAILDQYHTSLSATNLNYMVGAAFNESTITAWFNNQGYHTAPLAVNLINNAMLK